MKTVIVLSLFAVMFLATSPDLVDAKKKKKKKSKEEDPLKKDSKMFDSKTMQCLVCQYTIDEFEAAIYKVDPKKMIDTGTFRVDDKGSQKRSVVCVVYIYFGLVRFHGFFSRFPSRGRKSICSN